MASEENNILAEWRANLREIAEERAEGSRRREDGHRWIDKVLDSPESFQEIGAFGQNSGETDALVCGWGLVRGAKVFVIADNYPSADEPRTPTGIAKASRVQQLAADRGTPVVELAIRQRRDGAEFVGAELGIWGFGVDFHGLRRLRESAPRAIVIDGAITAQSCMDCTLADYVVLGPGGAVGLQDAVRPSAGSYGLHGVDWVTDDMSQAIDCVVQFTGLVTAPVTEPVAPAPGSTLLSTLCDAGSCLEIAPVSGSAVQLALCRVDGVSVGAICLQKGSWGAETYRRLENFIRLCERRRLCLLWITTSAADEANTLPRESALVCRALAEANLASCHLFDRDHTNELTDQLSNRTRTRLALPLNTPPLKARALFGAALQNAYGVTAGRRGG